MSQLRVDLETVRKYNVPGPRYTSYPPATSFHPGYTAAQLEADIEANNRSARGLSLYFHIPFCQSLCWYCGCTTIITTRPEQGATYVSYLEKEVARVAARINPERRVVQMHLGGGSPTFLAPDQICALGAIIHRHFQMAEDVEAGVEIDPRRLTPEHVAAFREIGFNRASVGVQDFNPEVQRAVHRVQPREMIEQVIRWLREAGFQSLNLDLIYGLPHQTVESFSETLALAMDHQPDRFAVFNYAHVPWIKPAQKILEKAGRPSPELKLEILKRIVEQLTGDGRYVYIGMDHFARPTDELAVAQRQKKLQRNFQGYSTRGGADIYAFGMSSISQIPDAYWQNHKELKDYYGALDAGAFPLARGYAMTAEDKLRREVIMNIMCNLGLEYGPVSARIGVDVPSYFQAEIASLDDLEADGLIRRTPDALEITPEGRLFIRNIAMRFDRCLPAENERRFSRTV